MFHVLIADDEHSAVQSLVSSIPWEQLGLQVIGTASDGTAALKTAQEEHIDIAVLDIRMPGINGLELCERLKQINDQIQLIIASGYAEFAYAEKAIQYGVLGYCLKPLDYAQMTRYLRKAIQNLNKTRYLPGRDELIGVLERQDEKEIQEYLSRFGLSQEKYFVAVSTGERELDIHGVSLRLGRRQWGYIMKTPLPDWLEDKEDRLRGCNGVGYMRQPVNGKDIYTAFEECIVRAFQYFVCKENKICGSLDEPGRWLHSIQAEIRANNWNRVDAVLEEIAQHSWQDFTARSALRLYHLILSGLAPQEEEEGYYVYSMEQMVNCYGTFQEMLRQMRHLLKENLAEVRDSKGITNASFIKLIKYVNANYMKEISLTSVAQTLHMNSNYVSQLFKKEAGVTFVQYITQKRMEDAKELLTTTQKPLTDIALEIGFNDTFYFVKAFKKFTGMTPIQYRTNS